MIMNPENQVKFEEVDEEAGYPAYVITKENEKGAYGLGFRAVRTCTNYNWSGWEILEDCFTAQFAAQIESIEDVTETEEYGNILGAKYVPPKGNKAASSSDAPPAKGKKGK